VDGELTRYYSLQNVGFNFEWYVFISKTYKEVQSTLDEEEEQNAPVIQVKKKAKKVCS
jgi:protein BCP1